MHPLPSQGRGLGGLGRFPTQVHNPLQHGGHISPNIFIADSQDAQAARRQDPITLGIVVPTFSMNLAIRLDDQAGAVAVEVHARIEATTPFAQSEIQY